MIDLPPDSDVLVVAAHPDDEVLGCGATLARLAIGGSRVHVVLATDGVSGRHAATAGDAESRRVAADRVSELLGTAPPIFLDFPDQRLDGIDLLDVSRRIEQVLDDVQPTLVLTHDSIDLNLDHELINRAVMTATRPTPGTPWTTIMTFETPSASEYGALSSAEAFRPSVFVDVADQFSKKLAALDVYAGEMRSPPHPRSADNVEAMARLRGMTVGIELAEAFRLVYHRADDRRRS